MSPQPDNRPDKLSGLRAQWRAFVGIPTDIPTECRDHVSAFQTGEELVGDCTGVTSTA
jgi:hypothetical protein